jgi:hypothetical protein
MAAAVLHCADSLEGLLEVAPGGTRITPGSIASSKKADIAGNSDSRKGFSGQAFPILIHNLIREVHFHSGLCPEAP